MRAIRSQVRPATAARETVVQRYSGQQWAPRFVEVLEEGQEDRPDPLDGHLRLWQYPGREWPRKARLRGSWLAKPSSGPGERPTGRARPTGVAA
ncbi:MAG: hypothetical protein QOJ93_804, partial [Actinomycetota bacterium]|nr:hypothetical protein [Actinomycetota bacterium]